MHSCITNIFFCLYTALVYCYLSKKLPNNYQYAVGNIKCHYIGGMYVAIANFLNFNLY
jgi:hypothetical protein